MNVEPMYPDAAQRIMAIVKSTFGTTFTYYLGMPDNFMPAQDAYPIVIVDKSAGTFKVGPTTADDITEHVFIHIMVDVKTGFGAPDDDNNVKRQLQTYVEGRDPTTGYLLPRTFMYALRTHLTLNSQSVAGIVTINNDINISYDSVQRQNQPETREAVIDITVTERQMVLNRN
jgi:hypothetical protein